MQAFFHEFLELFFPEVAARLDFGRVVFLDKEVFTDVPEGSRRELDLVAQVYTQDGAPELILLHIEVQAQREREFPYRMFEYYALLRLRYKVPVFPVVVYLVARTGGLSEVAYEERLFGQAILTFRFQSVGLPDLASDDYRAVDNPLAPALSALMQPGSLGRTLQKALSLRQTLGSPVDEARKSLLINIIETYMRLSETEDEEFRRLIRQEELQEVTQMLTIYEERGIIKGKRDALLKQLRFKFGDVPEAVAAKVQAIDTEAELDALLERVLQANTLADMGL
ncbi:MAG: Rpn family recombination-promoting nuclease/putative transposase [Candidatus Entotheonellia bacterium]